MAAFTNFQDVLPDPNNTIGDAGQVAGTAGPGYASVRLSSENSTMRTRTNSGRLISRAIGYHLWKISIEYNPMTREDFQRIYNFLIHKRGGLTPFFVSLPQYRIPQDSAFADFIGTEDTMLVNYGYQGVVSAIDALCGRHDVIVYDAESHACIIDGLRLVPGHRYVFKHNDVADCEKQLQRAVVLAEKTGGGILVITEGVFGMSGSQGRIKEIAALKAKYPFRLMVDDAHGFGTMGKTGAGVGEEQNCMKEIDVYFSTFAKSMASIGGFFAGDKKILTYLRYNMRSQVFAKSLPMPIVVGALKRLELIRTQPELKAKLWHNVNRLQNGLKESGFNIGVTNTPVTPVFLSGGLFDAVQLIYDMRENHNIFCSVVVYPVIPKGQIMLRLIPTAVHTDEDIDTTLEVFKKLRTKLDNKEYPQEMPKLNFA